MPDPRAVFDRILQTLGAKNAPEAARLLGLSKQSVYDWQKNIPSIDNLLKVAESGNASLHWLLTGQGERYVEAAKVVSVEEVIEFKIRQIVRDELAAALPLQDLGTVDDFDIASAVKKYDNAVLVLRDWYTHDHLPVPSLQRLSFHGWDEMPLKEKVNLVRSVRENIDEDQSFELQRKTSQHSKPPKKI